MESGESIPEKFWFASH